MGQSNQEWEERMAYHEASHAVVAMALDNTVNWVGIVTLGRSTKASTNEYPEVHVDPEHAGGCDITYWSSPAWPDQLTVLFAGLAGEGFKWGTASKQSSGGDLEAINHLLGSEKMSAVDQLRYREMALSKATQILEDQWDAVDRLATALLEHKELDSKDVLFTVYPELCEQVNTESR